MVRALENLAVADGDHRVTRRRLSRRGVDNQQEAKAEGREQA
jgi:hypothetical protein